MYDKFDDDIEKSGLRFDGNEPTFNKKRVKKIMSRIFLVAFIILFIVVFFERQRYNIHDRHLVGYNSVVVERGVVAESGYIIISQIHFNESSPTLSQLRFHLLVPNPFFGGNMYDAEITANYGEPVITHLKNFWWCQMLLVTFMFTEEYPPPASGENLYIAVRYPNGGIHADLTVVMP